MHGENLRKQEDCMPKLLPLSRFFSKAWFSVDQAGHSHSHVPFQVNSKASDVIL